MDNFANILQKNFGLNQPILAKEIKEAFSDVSEVTVYNWLNKAMEAGLLRKFRRGVYYLPKESAIPGFGEAVLSSDLVIQKQYISDGEKVYGYRSGLNLENEVGISPQVPATLEITTNNASKRVRGISPFGGYREITLRKPRTEVTKENVDALRFLDLITRVPLAGLTSFERKRMKEFVRTLDRGTVLQCLRVYPAKTAKNLLESEYFDVLTQQPGSYATAD